MLSAREKFLLSTYYLGIIIQNIRMNPRGGFVLCEAKNICIGPAVDDNGTRPCYGKRYRREAGGTDDGQDFGNEILYAAF